MKYPRGLDFLQKISMTLMAVMVGITFLGANLHAILWKSSDWLVSTVLPAVVVELTNEERVDNNATPLRRSATLDAAAKLKAQHMARNEYFSHYAPDGTTPWFWFDEAGYTYAHAGENLAIHFTDSDEVVEAWMDSPSHRKNIMDGKFTEIGVGTAKGTYDGFDTVYVVQLFGAPAIPPTPVAQASAPVAVPATVTEPVIVVEPEPELETNVLAVEDTAEIEAPVEVAEEAPEVVFEAEVEEFVPEPESVSVPEPVNVVTQADDVVIVEKELISTSSGLAVANITETNTVQEKASLAGLATRPHLVLEVIYIGLAVIVLFLLVSSLVIESRKVHPVQVAYSGGMLAAMALLVWLHAALIHGAVIV